MKLTNSDVQEILRLLDDTSFDELHLKTEHFNLSLKRTGMGWTQQKITTATPDVSELSVRETVSRNKAGKDLPEVSAGNNSKGLEEIRAPMVGTFYRAPKPGSEPFVKIGDKIEEQSVIAIIEVMKLMNSIAAGVTGEVVEILAEDAQFVEKGQLLMRVKA